MGPDGTATCFGVQTGSCGSEGNSGQDRVLRGGKDLPRVVVYTLRTILDRRIFVVVGRRRSRDLRRGRVRSRAKMCVHPLVDWLLVREGSRVQGRTKRRTRNTKKKKKNRGVNWRESVYVLSSLDASILRHVESESSKEIYTRIFVSTFVSDEEAVDLPQECPRRALHPTRSQS